MRSIMSLISIGDFDNILYVRQSLPGAVSLFLLRTIFNSSIVKGVLEDDGLSMAS